MPPVEGEAGVPALHGRGVTPQSEDLAAPALEQITLEDQLFPAHSPARVKELLEEIQNPSQPPNLSSLPPSGDDTLMVARAF